MEGGREQTYHARIPAELATALAVLAKHNRRSINAEIILAVEAWLRRHPRPGPSGT